MLYPRVAERHSLQLSQQASAEKDKNDLSYHMILYVLPNHFLNLLYHFHHT